MGKIVAFLASFSVAMTAYSAPPPPALSDVLSMLRAQVPDDAVRAYIEAENLYFRLSAEDVVSLKEAGAGSDLLVFLLDRRAVDPPIATEGAELIYESEGFRAFKKKAGSGKEVIVLTNIDEKGRRMDRPPDIAVDEPALEEPPISEPPEEPLVDFEMDPRTNPQPTPPPAAIEPRSRGPRGTVYVGPFYQFVPSNLPGPGSPWSPVFQIVPVWGGYPWGVSVYPFYQLGPAFPPGFPLFRYSR